MVIPQGSRAQRARRCNLQVADQYIGQVEPFAERRRGWEGRHEVRPHKSGTEWPLRGAEEPSPAFADEAFEPGQGEVLGPRYRSTILGPREDEAHRPAGELADRGDLGRAVLDAGAADECGAASRQKADEGVMTVHAPRTCSSSWASTQQPECDEHEHQQAAGDALPVAH